MGAHRALGMNVVCWISDVNWYGICHAFPRKYFFKSDFLTCFDLFISATLA